MACEKRRLGRDSERDGQTGHVFTRRRHRVDAIAFFHCGIDKAPAHGGVSKPNAHKRSRVTRAGV